MSEVEGAAPAEAEVAQTESEARVDDTQTEAVELVLNPDAAEHTPKPITPQADKESQSEPPPSAEDAQGAEPVPKAEVLTIAQRKEAFGSAVITAEEEIKNSLDAGTLTPEQTMTANKIMSLRAENKGDIGLTLSLLRQIKTDKAIEAYKKISKEVKVRHNEKDDSLSELEEERIGADETRQKEIEAILTKGEYRESFSIDKRRVEQAIDQGEKQLAEEIKKLKKEGTNVENRQNILGLLRFVRDMEGRGGAFLKYRALVLLKNVGGISVDEETLKELEPDARESEQAIFDHLTLEVGLDTDKTAAVIEGLRTGNIKPLIENRVFQRIGVEKLFFGKEQTDKEREDLVKKVFEGDPRYESMKDYLMTHKKDVGMMLLMLLYMGMTSDQVKKLIGLP